MYPRIPREPVADPRRTLWERLLHVPARPPQLIIATLSERTVCQIQAEQKTRANEYRRKLAENLSRHRFACWWCTYSAFEDTKTARLRRRATLNISHQTQYHCITKKVRTVCQVRQTSRLKSVHVGPWSTREVTLPSVSSDCGLFRPHSYCCVPSRPAVLNPINRKAIRITSSWLSDRKPLASVQRRR